MIYLYKVKPLDLAQNTVSVVTNSSDTTLELSSCCGVLRMIALKSFKVHAKTIVHFPTLTSIRLKCIQLFRSSWHKPRRLL